MKSRLLALFLPLAFVLPGAANAQRADIGVSYQKQTRHGNFEINFGTSRNTCLPPVRTARGHYETVTERVWVPAVTRQVWVPARYRTVIDPCGRHRQVLVRDGHYKTVCDPGYYDVRTRRVWVPASRITRGRGYDRQRGNRGHRDSRFGRRGRRF